MLTFLALADMVDAAQRMGLWGCDVNVPCTCDVNVKVQCAKTAGRQSNLASEDWCNRWLVETCKRFDSIPPSLRFLGMAKSILRFSNVFNKRYAWRWEHTGTNLMAEMGQQVNKLSFGA